MKLSSKIKYALMALIEMSLPEHINELVSTKHLSEHLGISKIYLEQIFSALNGAGLVMSERGSQGGHKLALTPENVSVRDIYNVFENLSSEVVNITTAPAISEVLTTSVTDVLYKDFEVSLSKISLVELVNNTVELRPKYNVHS
jgi:Rrf2 family protein